MFKELKIIWVPSGILAQQQDGKFVLLQKFQPMTAQHCIVQFGRCSQTTFSRQGR
jgi:hypothetical protein